MHREQARTIHVSLILRLTDPDAAYCRCCKFNAHSMHREQARTIHVYSRPLLLMPSTAVAAGVVAPCIHRDEAQMDRCVASL